MGMQNNFAQSVEMMRKAVNLLPGDVRPLMGLGKYLLFSEKYSEAAAALEEALSLNPHYGTADARFMLSEALEGLGQIDKAATLWREIIKMKPMYPSEDRPMIEAKLKLAKHGLDE